MQRRRQLTSNRVGAHSRWHHSHNCTSTFSDVFFNVIDSWIQWPLIYGDTHKRRCKRKRPFVTSDLRPHTKANVIPMKNKIDETPWRGTTKKEGMGKWQTVGTIDVAQCQRRNEFMSFLLIIIIIIIQSIFMQRAREMSARCIRRLRTNEFNRLPRHFAIVNIFFFICTCTNWFSLQLQCLRRASRSSMPSVMRRHVGTFMLLPWTELNSKRNYYRIKWQDFCKW